MKWFLLLFCIFCQAQKNDIWYPFYNQDSTLMGYKDEKNTVKIIPKFVPSFTNRKFDNVMSVMEVTKEGWKDYYLTKSGKQFGIDSTYTFDMTFDCENEGFIRFKDAKTSESTGLFDLNVNIIIPAKHNQLSKVVNGTLVALKDAKKKYDGEHFWWIDGQEILIDTKNNILIENFKDSYPLNFYSMKISDKPILDSIRENYLGTNGKYYSFIHEEKEFRAWFKNIFLKNPTKENIIQYTFHTLSIWRNHEKKMVSNKVYIEENFKQINKILNLIFNSKNKYTITKENLGYLFDDKEFEIYEEFYDNCSQSKDWIYPQLDVTIDNNKGRHTISFLKTKEGYKLIDFNTNE
ncbi:hypothetical protein [Empedobacter falsenii]|uniref:hypothetical protein n=1 Tax=Empedobacter falsenii TaxID=343874 RepID=UPI001C8E327D|nr:hypothetical protein [Empedobacter falsenii]MBY0067015.1 hypothetical protein [Empedobacter falsenii]